MQAPRRQFAVALAFVLLGGAAVVTGCGSSPTSPTSPQSTGTPATAGNLYGSVSENHPQAHSAMITAAQLSAGVGITLDITNGSHSHTVSITDADMREIAAKVRVSITSSQNPHSDGSFAHRHTVTFN